MYIAENSSPYSGVVGVGVVDSGGSPGLPLTLPAEPPRADQTGTASHSPDTVTTGGLTVLQAPSASSYSTMLPSFGYSSGKYLQPFFLPNFYV